MDTRCYAAYQNGSFQFSDVKAGVSVDGDTLTFAKDSKVSDYRTTIVTPAHGVEYDVYPTITLKSNERIRKVVEDLYANSDFPTAYLDNYPAMEVRREGGAVIGNFPLDPNKRGRDQLQGVSMAADIQKDVTYENDPALKLVRLTYTTKVTEQTNITDIARYRQAVSDGLILPETHGTWYDLLPKGVVPILDSVRLARAGDTLTRVRMIRNYRNSGRIMLIVEADLKPAPANGKEAANMSGYFDQPTMVFDAVYSHDNLDAYGKELINVIAFESGNDQLGISRGWVGEPDDPTVGNHVHSSYATEGVTALMTGLHPDRFIGATQDKPNAFIYAKNSTPVNVNVSGSTGLTKNVSVNDSGVYGEGKTEDTAMNVYDGGIYQYKLSLKNDDQTKAKDIILFDNLEEAEGHDDYGNNVGDKRWKGTLIGVDVNALKAKGIDPKVYYSTQNIQLFPNSVDAPAVTLSNEAIWHELPVDKYEDADFLKQVKMVAIDCTKDTEGKPFTLLESEGIQAYLRMRAPSVSNLTQPPTGASWYDTTLQTGETEGGNEGWTGGGHAYNGVDRIATLITANSVSQTSLIRAYYTKVGLKERRIKVQKIWDDEENKDNLRPSSITVKLMRDGEPTGRTLTLDAGNNWRGEFGQIYPSVTPTGEPIAYTIQEDPVPTGYRSKVVMVGSGDVQTANVTNIHRATRISISGEKRWEGDEDAERPSEVSLVLYANGVKQLTRVVKADAQGRWRYSFDNLPKKENGQDIRYEIKEEPALDNYVATISTPVVDTEGNQVVNITNKFIPYGELKISKKVDGVTPSSENQYFTFYFSLKGADPSVRYAYDIWGVETIQGEFVPHQETVKKASGTIRSGESFQLKHNQYMLIHKLPVGSEYQVIEDEVAHYQSEPSGGYEGIIKAQKEGVTEPLQLASFTNHYSSEGEVVIKGKKQLEGRRLAKDQFKFGLYEMKNGSENLLQTTRNREDGSFEFDVIHYTMEDYKANQNFLNNKKVWTYYVREFQPNPVPGGYTYDKSGYKVTVTLDDNGNGKLVPIVQFWKLDTQSDTGTSNGDVDIEGPEGKLENWVLVDDMRFINRYQAKGEVELKAWKQLSGRPLKDNEFTFELTDNQNDPHDVKLPTPVQVTNKADGSIPLPKLIFTQDDLIQGAEPDAEGYKTYRYTLREVAGSDDGVSYSTQQLQYIVKVKDNGDGTLAIQATVKNAEGADDATVKPIFKNTLKPGNLAVSKMITGNTVGKEDTAFDFTLTLTNPDGSPFEGSFNIQSEETAPSRSIIFNMKEAITNDYTYSSVITSSGTTYYTEPDDIEADKYRNNKVLSTPSNEDLHKVVSESPASAGSAKVTLYARGVKVAENTVENGGTVRFENLPAYLEAEDYTYTVTDMAPGAKPSEAAAIADFAEEGHVSTNEVSLSQRKAYALLDKTAKTFTFDKGRDSDLKALEDKVMESGGDLILYTGFEDDTSADGVKTAKVALWLENSTSTNQGENIIFKNNIEHIIFKTDIKPVSTTAWFAAASDFNSVDYASEPKEINASLYEDFSTVFQGEGKLDFSRTKSVHRMFAGNATTKKIGPFANLELTSLDPTGSLIATNKGWSMFACSTGLIELGNIHMNIKVDTLFLNEAPNKNQHVYQLKKVGNITYDGSTNNLILLPNSLEEIGNITLKEVSNNNFYPSALSQGTEESQHYSRLKRIGNITISGSNDFTRRIFLQFKNLPALEEIGNITIPYASGFFPNFSGCSNLERIGTITMGSASDGLINFYEGSFGNLKKLKTVDLSGIKLSPDFTTDMKYSFENCHLLFTEQGVLNQTSKERIATMLSKVKIETQYYENYRKNAFKGISAAGYPAILEGIPGDKISSDMFGFSTPIQPSEAANPSYNVTVFYTGTLNQSTANDAITNFNSSYTSQGGNISYPHNLTFEPMPATPVLRTMSAPLFMGSMSEVVDEAPTDRPTTVSESATMAVSRTFDTSLSLEGERSPALNKATMLTLGDALLLSEHEETTTEPSVVTTAEAMATNLGVNEALAATETSLPFEVVAPSGFVLNPLGGGQYSFKLKGGQTAVFKNLPGGTIYSVEEDNKSLWEMTGAIDTDGTIAPNVTRNAVFTNDTGEGKVSAQIEALKTLDGVRANANAFAFELYRVEEDNSLTLIEQVRNRRDGKILFSPLVFEEETGAIGKDVDYVVKEVNEGQAGTVYDNQELRYRIHYMINGSAKSISGPSVVSGASDKTFKNTTQKGSLRIIKRLTSGKVSKDTTFTIRVILDEGKLTEREEVLPLTLYKASNDVEASAVLSDLPIGTTYHVVEENIPPGYVLEEIEYPSTSHVISQAEETVEVAVNNRYEPKGEVSLEGMKRLVKESDINNNVLPLKAEAFSFALYRHLPGKSINEDMSVDPVATATNIAQGNFYFGHIALTELPRDNSIPLFILKEVIPNADDLLFHYPDIVFDHTLYGVYVDSLSNVVDDGEGNVSIASEHLVFKTLDSAQLEAVNGIPTSEALAKVTFTNKQKLMDVHVSKRMYFNANKGVTQNNDPDAVFRFKVHLQDGEFNALSGRYKITYDGAEGLDNPSTIADGETFLLKADATATIKDLPNGSVFKVEELEKIGYALQEVRPFFGGNKHQATIFVNEEDFREFPSYSTVTFTNELVAEDDWIPKAEKQLEGASLRDRSFTFVLYDQEGVEIDRVTNDEDGHIRFNPIHFTARDIGQTMTYTIREYNDHQDDIVYDEKVLTYEVTPLHIDNTTTDATEEGLQKQMRFKVKLIEGTNTFVNIRQYHLPATGRNGIRLGLLLGFMLIAGCGYYIRRRL